MSKNSNKPTRPTYTRFLYSVIDYFVQSFPLSFDISSYIQNGEQEDCRLASSRIGRYIQRFRKKDSTNRLLLAISLNDTGTKIEARKIIQSITDEVLGEFLNSHCIEMLRQIDSTVEIETFSTKEHSSLTDYIIIIFNVSTESSIECIISTDAITSKLIDRDEDGEVVEFNSMLHKNIRSFQINLK